MTKILALFLALLLLAVPAMASKVTPVKLLSISVDHGVTLTLDAPATSVFVANPDIADVQVMSPTSIMIFGKRTGETSFVASDAAGHALEQRTIAVTQDLSDLRRELDLAIPGHKIHASSLPNGIVLTGEAKDAATVADAYKMAQRYIPTGGDIINRVKVGGSNQIQIRVRFAEVQRNIDNSLGIDWANFASYGGFVFGLATGNTVNTALQGTSNTNGVTGLFPRPNNTGLSLPNDVLGVSRTGGRLNLNAMIDALAQDGLVTILAEPNLTAMSGETANFLAGGEFPIPIPEGNGTISIEFKNYGVSLAFTPTLVGENRINMHVKPEVSELTSTGSIILSNITIPAITTRRAETTVEVASGQSFAIAGLLDKDQSQTVNKYPLLGDMPVLGALFRSSRFQDGQTELVIIITPYIVKPNGEQQLAMPTDGYSAPSEQDRLADLRSSSSDPNARPFSGPPTAARGVIVPPTATLPPAPIAAPVTSVAPASPAAPIAVNEPPPGAVVPAAEAELSPVSAPTPAARTNISLNPPKAAAGNLSPETEAPSGPGGFILE